MYEKFDFQRIFFIDFVLVFLCCQIQATPINNDNSNEMKNADLIDALHELFFNQQDQFVHQPNRRASLRYHPRILYKKASLKPIVGQNGKLVFVK
jgi:hypothetical protein